MVRSTLPPYSFPTIVLKDSILQVPGVTFNLSVSNNDAFEILHAYLDPNSKFLSKNIKKSLNIIKSKINISNDSYSEQNDLSPDVIEMNNQINLKLGNRKNEFQYPIFATLFNDESNDGVYNVGIISTLVKVQILSNQVVLGLKGHCKAFLADNNLKIDNNNDDAHLDKYKFVGDLQYEKIQFIDEADYSNVNKALVNQIYDGVKENLSIINKFLVDYLSLNASSDSSSDSDFKSTLYKLNPILELLYVQLSDSNTSTNLEKLTQLINALTKDNNEFFKILNISDIYVAIFPFTHKQKIKYLTTSNVNEQLESMNELIHFVNKLFIEYCNIDYVFDSWKRLGKLQNGKALQSRFILNHFNNLKQLLDKTASFHKPMGKGPVKRANNFRANNILPSNKDADTESNELHAIEEFINNIDDYEISKDGKTLLIKDFKRLKKMQSSSSEYQQLRNYMDIVLELPWTKKSNAETANNLDIDLVRASKILDNEHHGMESVKERVLEHLAILKLTEKNADKSLKSPILLLNGPPGVGKTSFAKSIANSLNCEFKRISLGGINDFADIKGHRRTYVGAIPGLLIQALRRSKTMNPVILLDEIDKVGMANNKGNPEAALLEILDPEQNVSFNDHYIGFPIDLSKIIFIATSNDKWDISEPLLDRMETIDLDGYNCKEKVKIAKRFILPRQLKRNGLDPSQLKIDDEILENIAILYTHEAGIRNFERLIGNICRKKAVELITLNDKSKYEAVLAKEDLIRYLGVPRSFSDSEKYSSGNSIIQEEYGLVNGLSYNSDGSGSLLKFEMVGVPGSQRISSTGRLGEVLIESSEIASTLVDYLINSFLFIGYDEEKLIRRLENTSVHMHVPEGSVRKDGPSAGLTMTLCYLSLILQKPVDPSIAMTGEITLTAKALPIGGLKEKILGAGLTGKIRKVIVPRLNRNDLIKAYVKSIKDRNQAKLVLTKLVLEEEECLINKSKRHSFANDVEDWIKDEYGINIKYVDDFMDVINEVWDGNLQLVHKEVKANL